MMLYEVNKGDTSPNFRSVGFPRLQTFVEILCTNLRSPLLSRHVSVSLWYTNMHAWRPENSVGD